VPVRYTDVDYDVFTDEMHREAVAEFHRMKCRGL
jgi:hypothetical protein